MKREVFNSEDAIAFNKRLGDLLVAVKNAMANRSSTIGGERYLTTREVCELLNINAGTLQQYRNEYRIGYVKLTRKILFRESDIVRILNENYIPRHITN
jgi:excisionase family DNA binding protein